MIRRPPRSTQGVSSAASDVYKRQVMHRDCPHLREEPKPAGVGGERRVPQVLPQRPSEILRELYCVPQIKSSMTHGTNTTRQNAYIAKPHRDDVQTASFYGGRTERLRSGKIGDPRYFHTSKKRMRYFHTQKKRMRYFHTSKKRMRYVLPHSEKKDAVLPHFEKKDAQKFTGR